MNPRLAKEFRTLLVPWGLCAVAGFGHLARLVSIGGVPGFFLTTIAAFAFCAGCLMLAALPLGSEFQQRTLPLLMSQPIKRSRIWQEKIQAATLAVLALVLVHGSILIALGGKMPLKDSLPLVGFTVATICSAGFCALATRSVIGGSVFAMGGQFIVMAVASAAISLCYKFLGRDLDTNEWPVIAVYVCAGVGFELLHPGHRRA